MNFRFQFSLFADLASISASPEEVMATFQRLNKHNYGLLPTTMQELLMPDLATVTRLRFVNAQTGLEVSVPRSRIDVVHQWQRPDGPGVGQVVDFIDVAQNCIEALLAEPTILGHRLAFVVQEMSPAMSPDEFRSRFSRLFTPPSFYEANPPHEWTFRANTNTSLSFSDRTELPRKDVIDFTMSREGPRHDDQLSGSRRTALPDAAL